MRCRGVSWLEAAVPSVCLVGLLVCPRITRKVPGPLLTPPALAIAMLGAIESLMSAVVSDGMTQTQHDPDAELFAQGVGNLVSPVFGGIA